MAKNQWTQFSGKWQEIGVLILWCSSLSVDIVETVPSDNILVNKSGGGIKGSPMSRNKQQKMVKNGKKKRLLGKWWENGVVTAWSSFLFIDIILTAPSESFYVNTIRDWAKR